MVCTRSQSRKIKMASKKVAFVKDDIRSTPLFSFLATELSATHASLRSSRIAQKLLMDRLVTVQTDLHYMQAERNELFTEREDKEKQFRALLYATSQLLERSYAVDRISFFEDLRNGEAEFHAPRIDDLDDYDYEATEIDLTMLSDEEL